MPSDQSKTDGYDSLKARARKSNFGRGKEGPHSSRKSKKEGFEGIESLTNSRIDNDRSNVQKEMELNLKVDFLPGPASKEKTDTSPEIGFHELRKLEKKEKISTRDRESLENDFWLTRNGHTFSYVGLFLFSILVLFRPYELLSSLSFLSATAFYFAIITLAFYFPTQLLTEGTISTFTTEIKAILALTLLALITMPLAKSPGTAWETFNDMFIKAVLMFVVMVNVLRSRQRLMGMMWLSLSVGLYLSYVAVNMYWRGELNAEGYRVSVDVGGMFGNPNDLALHLVTMTPIAIGLGIAAKRIWLKALYFIMATFFVGATMVTYSRGGFLGLLAVSILLSWKLGRNNRLKIIAIFAVVGILVLLVAPGNYGLRMLSIFVPGLDPVGSSNQRKDLLWRSILVTLRNPWGIGIGNFPIVGIRNLETHNAYTQVSSEIGVLGLAAYVTFMVSPFRKLSAIERLLLEKSELNWYYYVSIGLQGSILGFMVASFFGPVAYNWFIYYIIAYAVAFRRIYTVSDESLNAAAPKSKGRNKSIRPGTGGS